VLPQIVSKQLCSNKRKAVLQKPTVVIQLKSSGLLHYVSGKP